MMTMMMTMMMNQMMMMVIDDDDDDDDDDYDGDELLSALCVYNAEGYSRALEALDHYMVIGS